MPRCMLCSGEGTDPRDGAQSGLTLLCRRCGGTGQEPNMEPSVEVLDTSPEAIAQRFLEGYRAGGQHREGVLSALTLYYMLTRERAVYCLNQNFQELVDRIRGVQQREQEDQGLPLGQIRELSMGCSVQEVSRSSVHGVVVDSSRVRLPSGDVIECEANRPPGTRLSVRDIQTLLHSSGFPRDEVESWTGPWLLDIPGNEYTPPRRSFHDRCRDLVTLICGWQTTTDAADALVLVYKMDPVVAPFFVRRSPGFNLFEFLQAQPESRLDTLEAVLEGRVKTEPYPTMWEHIDDIS